MRSNLSFIRLPALENRDRFVPRDRTFCQSPLGGLRAQKIPVIASLRSNLSFTRLPAPNNRDCRATLAMTENSPAKQSRLSFLSFALSAVKTVSPLQQIQRTKNNPYKACKPGLSDRCTAGKASQFCVFSAESIKII